MLSHIEKFDLFTRRYFQITMAFMLFVFVQNYFNIPHAIWIVLSGAMIYGGFHSGSVVKRSYLRLTGTILGVAAVALVWNFLHWNYRLSVPYFVCVVWCCVFFQLLPYDKFIVIVTLLSDILVELPNTANFNVQFYILDRLACTLIAFALCVGIEYLWFGRSNMMYLNYVETKSRVKDMLRAFYKPTQSHTLNVSLILKNINDANAEIAKLSNILEDAKYETKRGYRQFQLSKADNQFNIDMIALFRQIISIYYLQKHHPESPKIPLLMKEVEMRLEQTN